MRWTNEMYGDWCFQLMPAFVEERDQLLMWSAALSGTVIPEPLYCLLNSKTLPFYCCIIILIRRKLPTYVQDRRLFSLELLRQDRAAWSQMRLFGREMDSQSQDSKGGGTWWGNTLWVGLFHNSHLFQVVQMMFPATLVNHDIAQLRSSR